MRSNARGSVGKGARYQCRTVLVCALACSANAGPAPPRPAGSGPTIMIEESPGSRVLYFEESGGLLTPLIKPPPDSARIPLPPLPTREAKVPTPGPRVVRTDTLVRKTKLAKVPGVAIAPNTVAHTSISPIDGELQLDRRIDIVAVVARLSLAGAAPAERARHMDESIGPVVVSYQNAQAALQLGWLLLEWKEPATASTWFQRARSWRSDDQEATHGLALAALAELNYATALVIAADLSYGSSARADVLRAAWMGIGQREYDAAHYGGAIEAFDHAAVGGELPRYARLLRAWSGLKVGDKAAAGDFARLYRELPDIEAAQGMMAASPGDPSPNDALLASTEPLASLLRERAGAAAFQSRRYLEARALDPSRWSGVGSPGVVAAQAALGRREKTGVAGLGKLTADLGPGISGSIPLGERAAISLSTDRMQLDAGRRQLDTPVGTAPIGKTLGLADGPSHTTIRESTLSLRMERNFAIVASLGSGVQGGRTESKPVGSVEALAVPAWGQTEVRAFIEPVRESVLSWAGLSDPHSGSVWGSVRRRGVESRALYLGSAPYSAGIHLRLEQLVGTQVANNVHRAIDVSAGRDLGLPGFAYSSLALIGSFDAFKRNLSHYTLGHGGYFSPQSHRKAGIAFDFMTAEAKSWLVRGRMSATRVWKREDETPFFPLDADGRTYKSSRTKGYDASFRMSAVAQLSPRIQTGLAIGRGISPQFGDKLALLEFRVLLDPRRGVVSADLPAVRGE